VTGVTGIGVRGEQEGPGRSNRFDSKWSVGRSLNQKVVIDAIHLFNQRDEVRAPSRYDIGDEQGTSGARD